MVEDGDRSRSRDNPAWGGGAAWGRSGRRGGGCSAMALVGEVGEEAESRRPALGGWGGTDEGCSATEVCARRRRCAWWPGRGRR